MPPASASADPLASVVPAAQLALSGVSPLGVLLIAVGVGLGTLALRARRKLGLSAATFCVALGCVDLLHFQTSTAGTCHHTGNERPSQGSPFDPLLGYGPVPDRQIPAQEMVGGGPGYDGVYTIDERGLRATPTSAGDEAVLFFGGSYTFGLGVSDEDTLAWRVGEALGERGRAHNFGYSGYGPHQMLAALEAGRVEELVDGHVTWVVFQLIPNHIRRVAGRAPWDPHGPRYVLTGAGGVRRAGRFCDPPVDGALARSGLLREFRRRVLGKEVELCAAITAAARDEVARRFPDAHFVVLLWEDPDRKSATLVAELRRRGVEVELVGDLLPGWKEDQVSAWNSDLDHHPSPRAHAVLAEHVVQRVLGAEPPPGAGAR